MTKRRSSNPRYSGERITNLVRTPSGLKARFVEWYSPKVGTKKDVACAFQVFINGDWFEICRYDSCHGVFHRHKAAWPAASRKRDAEFPNTPMGERGAIALADVMNNISHWNKLIPKEVIDDESSA